MVSRCNINACFYTLNFTFCCCCFPSCLLFSSLTLITSSEIILCHSLQMTTFLTLMGLTY